MYWKRRDLHYKHYTKHTAFVAALTTVDLLLCTWWLCDWQPHAVVAAALFALVVVPMSSYGVQLLAEHYDGIGTLNPAPTLLSIFASLAALPLLVVPATALLLQGSLIFSMAGLLSLTALGGALVYLKSARVTAHWCYDTDRWHERNVWPKKFKRAEQRRFRRKLAGVPYNTQNFGGKKEARSILSVSLMTAAGLAIQAGLFLGSVHFIVGSTLYETMDASILRWLILLTAAVAGYAVYTVNSAAATRGSAACALTGLLELLCASDIFTGVALNIDWGYLDVTFALFPHLPLVLGVSGYTALYTMWVLRLAERWVHFFTYWKLRATKLNWNTHPINSGYTPRKPGHSTARKKRRRLREAADKKTSAKKHKMRKR